MPKPTPGRLFHYTCDHGAGAIAAEKVLRPGASLFAGEDAERSASVLGDVIWLTDLDWVTGGHGGTAHLLGLHRINLRCDRTMFRAAVSETAEAVWWPTYRRELVGDARDMARTLSMTEGALPAHWWVSRTPLPVVELVPTILRREDAGRPPTNYIDVGAVPLPNRARGRS